MNDEDIRKFRRVVKDEVNSALKPVKKTLSEQGKILGRQNKILGVHGRILGEHGKKLDTIWDHAAKLTEDIAEIQITQEKQTKLLNQQTAILNKHTTSLNRLETTGDNVSKLNKRVVTLEDQAGIVPPPELTVVK